MAECATVSSYAKLRLQRRGFTASNFTPGNALPRIRQRKNCYRNWKIVVWLTSREICEVSAPIATISKGSFHLRRSSSRFCCLGTLISDENLSPSNLVSVVDQMLLMASIVLTYMAGALPSGRACFGSRKNILDHNAVPADTTSSGSATNNGQQVNSEYAWDAVERKLMGALNSVGNANNLDNTAIECENYSTKRPLSLYGISEGPRLRLLWATLKQLKKEVSYISGNYDVSRRENWLEVSSKIIQTSCLPVCLAWLEEELQLENKRAEKAIISLLSEKLKGDTILQNIKKSGKEDLYADLLFFLRFGFLGEGFCYENKLLTGHGVDILEDLMITLADGVIGMYLELISVDSNMSSEINSLDLILCRLSTRALQRLRNEVALNQWLHQNMESVVSMYEDRFDLYILCVQPTVEPKKSETNKFCWWKKLMLWKSEPTLSPLCYVVIGQLSMPVKRTMELRALTGWYTILPCPMHTFHTYTHTKTSCTNTNSI
uniref:Uncharacterized protein n=1 Tax=Nelumbo nucifera TaxID=4432 RepID=A0A822Y2N8_NELNU|nr:TPA_asm: hypothetical protein HUJ06_025361 [Nelumbo nucifera]